MAQGKGIRAGKAFVEAYLEDSKLKAGTKRALANLKRFGGGVAAVGQKMMMLGVAALAPLIGAAKLFSSAGDNVAKMARRTGMSVEALSELSFAASRSGTELDSLENGLRRMQRTIYDAERGLSTAVDALADLGLSMEDLQGLKPEEQFKLLADRISQVEDPSRKAAIAMTIFGRAGTGLIPMMEQGAAGIEALQAQARKLGLTISTEDATAAEEFTDTLGDLWAVIKHGAFLVGAALAPVLQDAARDIISGARSAHEWIKTHKSVIVTALKVAAAITGIGLAMMIIGKVIAIAATLVKVFYGIKAAIGAVHVAFALLAANPATAWLVAIGVAVGAVVVALKLLRRETERAMASALANLEAGDKARRVDQQRLDRLGQLANKQKLSNDETQEAKRLIGDLEGKYGELGISVNETTGKIEGFASALTLAADAMKALAIEQLEGTVRAAEADLADAQERLQRGGGVRAFGRRWFESELHETAAADIAIAWKQLQRTRSRLAAAKGGDREAIMGGGDEAADLAQRIASEEAGSAERAASEAQWARKVHQLKLQQIEDETERAKALINDRYDREMARAMEAGAHEAELDSIKEARRLELHATQIAADREVHEEKKRQVREDVDRVKGELQEEARLREQIADADAARTMSIDELRLRTTLKGYELEKALLALRKRQAIAAAVAAGENLELVKEEYALREQLLAQSQGVERTKNVVGAVGTFTASAFQSLLGGDNKPAVRTANAAEETARHTKDLLAEARRGGLVFA